MKRFWTRTAAALCAAILTTTSLAPVAGAQVPASTPTAVQLSAGGTYDPYLSPSVWIEQGTYPGRAEISVFATTDSLGPNGLLSIRDGGRLVWSQRADPYADPDVNLTNLAVGRHPMTLTYSGDGLYKAKTVKFSITIGRADPKMTVQVKPNGPLSAKLVVRTKTASNAPISAVFKDKIIARGKLVKGKATLTLPRSLKVGANSVTVRYAGSASYMRAARTVKVTATGYNPTIKAAAKTVTAPKKSVLTVSVTGSHGKARGTVNISAIRGKAFPLTDGKVSIQLPSLAAGTHQIRVQFNGQGSVYNTKRSVASVVVKKAAVTTPPPVTPNPPSPPAPPTQPTEPSYPGDRNCSDFYTQAAAQAFLEYYLPYYGDFANLDGDNDGIACETLP